MVAITILSLRTPAANLWCPRVEHQLLPAMLLRQETPSGTAAGSGHLAALGVVENARILYDAKGINPNEAKV